MDEVISREPVSLGDYTVQEILAQVFGVLRTRQRERQFDFYRPGKKHKAFFDAGRDFKQRAFCAGNRCGKTTAGCYEDVCHLTGLYPKWWDGHRFDRPTNGALMGNTTKQLRRAAQEVLLGPVGEFGTGMVPKELIVDGGIKSVHGVPGAVDYIKVWYKDKERMSTMYLYSAEMNWESLQGSKLDFFHQDEEPPPSKAMDIYNEIVPRLITQNGIYMLTATPQRKKTELMELFHREEGEDERPGDKYRILITMTVWDADHLTDAQIEELTALLPPSEHDARLRGIPAFGAGLVWEIAEDRLRCEPFDLGRPGLQFLAAMDSGYINNYTAVLWGAYSPADKTIYLVDLLKVKGNSPDEISLAIRSRDIQYGFSPYGIPMAWPWDMARGESLSKMVPREEYESRGVNMLPERAVYKDERGNRIDARIYSTWNRMARDQFKVFNTPTMEQWFIEWRNYRYDEDGNINKTKTRQYDLMDATQYLIVELDKGNAERAREVDETPKSLAFGRVFN